MNASDAHGGETYSPWTVVNVVFRHLAEQGLHPTLGGGGPPDEPAAALLRTLGISPAVEGDARASQRTREQLAELREQFMSDDQ